MADVHVKDSPSSSKAEFEHAEYSSTLNGSGELAVENGRRLTVASAAVAAQTEKEQTVRESIYNYSSAIGWSLLVSMLVIMEGIFHDCLQ